MSFPPVAEQLDLILRGTVDCPAKDDLEKKLTKSLATGKPLTIKAGFDPTAPDLHLGHTVLITKMRQFQDLGHRVVFLIGDFTAMIGDPTGRSATRKPLTRQDVLTNAETYKAQVFKILDPAKTEVAFNSTWLDALGTVGVVELTAKYTVARIMEREDFRNRFTSGISISVHELLYPLMQGYDSVAMKADVELGGTDQLFNLLVGRQLMKEYGLEPQCVLTTPILEGLDAHLEDGVLVGKKMSKSLANYVGIQEAPLEMVGKLMSVSDDLMWRYFDLLSTRKTVEIAALKAAVVDGSAHPMKVKGELAAELAGRYHGQDVGRAAVDEWMRIFSQRETPTDIPEVRVTAASDAGHGIVQLIRDAGLAESGGEARRLVSQGAVHLDGVPVATVDHVVPKGGPFLVKVGKRRFARVTVA
ncbi:MAG: tyrosine--tRNA ligase [Deltaproteobacteria bacterium]|nr:tyrosine--tRNA ligase [Deltaproteobacteria bacterium]